MGETWGTFSIYDHRSDVYRKSLILFDRVVIPVPKAPLDGTDLTDVEIDELSADVDYLERHGAAVRFDWDESRFAQYLHEDRTFNRMRLNQTLASLANHERNLLQDSRQHLVEWVRAEQAGERVTAIPVFASPDEYEEGRVTPDQFIRDLSVQVSQRLTVPSHDAPLEDIIRLREQPGFRESLERLRLWQSQIIPDILLEAGSVSQTTARRRISDAMRQFDDWLRTYRRFVDDARVKTVETSVLSILRVGLGLTDVLRLLPDAAEALFQLKKVRSSMIRDVGEYAFAPAALIYDVGAALTR